MKFLLCIILFLVPFQSKVSKFTYKQVPKTIYSKFKPNMVDYQEITRSYPNAVSVVKYLPKKYLTNGSVDYTSFIQKAIDENSILKFPNFPILINSSGLTLKSNSVIIFDSNSRLILKSNNKPHYQMLRVYNCNNVKIYFANLTGDKDTHIGKAGEFGMGISIRGSKNINVYKSFIEKCWGDGIYIDDYSKEIQLEDIYVDNNRRNGISIVYGSNITITNLLASNTNGTAPMAGLDIEPDNNSQVVDNIVINNAITYNNANRGILIALMNLPGNSKRQVNININSHIDYYSKNGLAFYPGSMNKKWENLMGNIVINNSDWSKSTVNPIFIPEGKNFNNIKVDIRNKKGIDLNTQNKIKSTIKNTSNLLLR